MPPKTPDQLADAIESLIESYLDDIRSAAKCAVERTLIKARPAAGRGAPQRVSIRSKARDRPGVRRSAEEIDGLCERLHELVSARPGEAMALFAEEIGVPVRSLQRPMSKLKQDGRVRSVGERCLTRYFPAVVRRPRGAEA